MSYIQKDTNTSLLILLVSILLVIGGLTVFYQVSFKEVNSKYTTKVNELNQTYQQLTQNLDVLNKTKEDLKIKELREGDLTNRYLITQKERDDLTAQNQELLSIKTTLENQIERLRANITIMQNDLNVANVRVRSCEETRDSLQTQLTQCQAT